MASKQMVRLGVEREALEQSFSQFLGPERPRWRGARTAGEL